VRTILLFLAATLAVSAQTSIRVNAGGPAYTDSKGNVWAADSGFIAGNGFYSTATAITGTSDPTLYQSEHWGAGTLEWAGAVPNGAYNVTLKFAEIWFAAAGQRIFSISINGQQVETNLDIFAAAGGQFKALDRTYPVVVSTGRIDIKAVSTVDNPKFSAIDIEPAVIPTPTPAPASGPSFADQETPGGAMDGANTTFSLAHTPSPANSLILVRNGIVLHVGADYTLAGNTITFKSFTLPGDLTFAAGIPQPGDILLAWYRY